MNDVVIVGAGFAGLAMAIALKRDGIENFVVLETANDVGGTWRDNVYPGCACDIPSILYSFSFEHNPNWSRAFPPQQEIWDYVRRCVDKYDLRKHIRFATEMVEARYDERSASWRVAARNGDTFQTRTLVCAMGALSKPMIPHLPGLERFCGPAFHSAQWNHAVGLAEKRVAVIGTGASAIQFVPEIAPKVAHLTLFQRTPPWIIGRPDGPVSPFKKRVRRFIPGYAWLLRKAIYWMLELRAYGFTVNPRALKLLEGIARAHLERQVPEPALRQALTPHYRMGCKRILISSDFYPALRRDNVAVVTTPIREVGERSVITEDGVEHAADVLIFATGFRVHDYVAPAKLYGREGKELGEQWRTGAQAYLGIDVAGYPNLHFLVGPNTGLGHNSMLLMIEAQVRYVMSTMHYMRARGLSAVDIKPEVQAAFNTALRRRLRTTVWGSGCRSWYLDDNGKNTTLWPGFTFVYRFLTRRFRAKDYILHKEPSP